MATNDFGGTIAQLKGFGFSDDGPERKISGSLLSKALGSPYFENSVLEGEGNEFLIVATSPASDSVVIKSGVGLIDGVFFELESDYIFDLGPAGEQQRVDSVGFLVKNTPTQQEVSPEQVRGTAGADTPNDANFPIGTYLEVGQVVRRPQAGIENTDISSTGKRSQLRLDIGPSVVYTNDGFPDSLDGTTIINVRSLDKMIDIPDRITLIRDMDYHNGVLYLLVQCQMFGAPVECVTTYNLQTKVWSEIEFVHGLADPHQILVSHGLIYVSRTTAVGPGVTFSGGLSSVSISRSITLTAFGLDGTPRVNRNYGLRYHNVSTRQISFDNYRALTASGTRIIVEPSGLVGYVLNARLISDTARYVSSVTGAFDFSNWEDPANRSASLQNGPVAPGFYNQNGDLFRQRAASWSRDAGLSGGLARISPISATLVDESIIALFDTDEAAVDETNRLHQVWLDGTSERLLLPGVDSGKINAISQCGDYGIAFAYENSIELYTYAGRTGLIWSKSAGRWQEV